MALAYKQRLATLDELAEEALRVVREEGEPIRSAVPRVLSALTPDNEAVPELCRIGLQTIVNQRINSGWMPDDEAVDITLASRIQGGRPVTGMPRKSRIKAGLELLARLNYEGADGRRRVFLDFNLADCVNLAKIAESRAHGYRQLEKAASTAASFLRTRGVATVGDLPEEDREKIGLYLVAAPEAK